MTFSVSCPSVDPPKSGNASIATDGSTSIAVFSCADGYLLKGDSTLKCGENGQWSDAFPECGN